MRESTVEKYLDDEVTSAGGATRKFSSAHRANNPDRIVIWPQGKGRRALIDFVETKAPLKTPRPGQEREHKRLRKLGCKVLVIDTKAKVDAYVSRTRTLGELR